jgi:chloride channel 3/4/5
VVTCVERTREILTASAAAGVAVAFGSPIGGVLFALEELSTTFSIYSMWRSFFCALVATSMIHIIDPFRTGKLVMFQVTYTRNWHFLEMFWCIVLGVFGVCMDMWA